MRFYLTLSFALLTFGLWAMPEQIIIMRHAEKPAHGDGDSLSSIGFMRANALVNYFENPLFPIELRSPVAIYAQRSDKAYMSTRPVQTVAPLANAWQVPLYTQYPRESYAKMVKNIAKTYQSGLVLICWSHDHLSNIATEFGVSHVPGWPDNEYDWVWVITFGDNKEPMFQTLLQGFEK